MNKSDFRGLGIAPNILKILDSLNFKKPTPIQSQCIPSGIEGKDMIGVAQTGTGKTLAFGVPMIQHCLAGKLGLIVLPTRELAIQVEEVLKTLGGHLGIRTVVLIGGEHMGRQIQTLRRGAQIVIGTPGRIIDHLERKTLRLDSVGVLILDEADRMFDMGFAPQLKRILDTLPTKRQTMLFSATMPENIVKLAKAYMQLPLRVEVAPQGTAAERVEQELFFIQREDKPKLLKKILYEHRGPILVFSKTKHGAHKIVMTVRSLGHGAAEIHSNRSLPQRKEALQGFKNGKYRVLVATDIAARGIDVKDIELVINYDLPENPEDYVHRIGRTGRAGMAGKAISFATPDQRGDVFGIERLIRTSLPPSKLPKDIPEAKVQPIGDTRRPSRRGGGARRYSSSSRRFGQGRRR